MTKKNEIPVYTAGIDELIHEINSRTNELMRNNFDNPLDGLLKIRPVKIDGIEYDHIALIHFDDYPVRVGARLVSTSFQTDLPVFKLAFQNDTAPLYDILSSVKKGYFSNEHTGEAVAANPAVYKFEVGERVKFSTAGPSGKEEPVTGEVEKAGTAYNIRHIFGAPAITVNGKEYFVDDIKENTLTVPAVSSYGFKGYDKSEDFRKDLSGLPVKDFDIQVDKEMLFPLETAWRERNLIEDHPTIRTVNIRNRQVQSVSGDYLELRGYNDKLQEELYADKQFSIDVKDLNSKEQQILSAFLARKILYYIKPWAKQLAEDIKTQEKADRVSARMGRLLALMPDPGDSMSFKKPMALDDYISTDGIGDMKITEIRNAGDGRFTVSDGERVIPFGRMMEWDQASVVTMCEQLDKKQNNDVVNQMEDNVNRQPETQKAQEAEEFKDVDNERVLSDADIASPEHQIREAIVERILNPSSDATFTKEQQDTIISYLKDYPTVDGKLQALSPLWQDAEKDARVKGEPKEWFEPVKEELNDLASGIRREPGEGMKLK